MTETRRPGLRSQAVRTSNLSTILRELHLNGAASRSHLVQRTGLTRTAVGALASELQANKLVFETTPEPDGSPGRPSPIVTPDSANNAVLALDLMVDSIGVMAVGLGGTVLRSVRRDRDRRNLDGTIADAANLIESVRNSLEPSCRLFGLGVAIAGLVRDADRAVVLAPNLGWVEIDVVAQLKDLFEPDFSIVVANEANLGALAESRRGSVAGHRDVLYLSGEVGVGGGIIVDGRLLTGSSGYAGEVGHVPVRMDGRDCRCGARGCLETEIGEEALLERIGRPPDGGRPAIIELMAAAEAGDSTVLDGLAEHSRWLAFGLTGLMNALNPSAVVLGGLLATLFPYLEGPLRAELDRQLFPTVPTLQNEVTILPSSIGVDAPAIGAAELAWDAALDEELIESLVLRST
jgi:predicted NBD/HSP70 family sugar kinase